MSNDDLSTYSEIQSQLYAQDGLFSTEMQTAGIRIVAGGGIGCGKTLKCWKS